MASNLCPCTGPVTEDKSAQDESPRVGDSFVAALAAACSIPQESGCREAKLQVRLLLFAVPTEGSSPFQEDLFFSGRVKAGLS